MKLKRSKVNPLSGHSDCLHGFNENGICVHCGWLHPEVRPDTGEKTFELHALAVYQLRIRAADRQQAVARFQAFVHWMKDGRDTILLPFPPDANLTVHELAVEPTNIKEENVREVRDGIYDDATSNQRTRPGVPRRVR